MFHKRIRMTRGTVRRPERRHMNRFSMAARNWEVKGRAPVRASPREWDVGHPRESHPEVGRTPGGARQSGGRIWLRNRPECRRRRVSATCAMRYSTVTLFARFLGLSTSQPLSTAM